MEAMVTMSVAEAAEYLGVSTRTLQNWVRDRKIPYRKTPLGKTRFEESVLQTYKHGTVFEGEEEEAPIQKPTTSRGTPLRRRTHKLPGPGEDD